jgi:hypothetical protein
MKIIVFFIVISFPIKVSLANKKIDLDDVSIKGELHNDQKLRLISRSRNNLKNHIKFRVNYRNRILEELPLKSREKYFYFRPIE